jgi:hypothetical protein
MVQNSDQEELRVFNFGSTVKTAALGVAGEALVALGASAATRA